MINKGWYRYKKTSDKYTDYIISGENIYEHGEIKGLTYVYIAENMQDNVVNPSQLKLTKVTLTTKEIKKLKKQSLHVKHVNENVSKKIRKNYSQSEEFQVHRKRTSKASEFSEYDSYVEDCVSWGSKEKAKFGI